MAKEDDDPETAASGGNSSPSSSAGDDRGSDRNPDNQEEGYRDFFVDRDDDGDPGFVDRDDDGAMPGADDDYNNVDPGYAAFASELDDPLADWPAPDVPLNELPEVRHQDSPADAPIADAEPTPEPSMQPAGDLNVDLPGDDGPSSNDGFPGLSAESRSSVHEELPFDESPKETADSRAPDLSDSDQLNTDDGFDDPLAEVEDYGVPEPTPEEEVSELVAPDELALKLSRDAGDYPESGVFPDDDDSDDYAGETFDVESADHEDKNNLEQQYDTEAGQKEVFAKEQEDFEEEFVDDFLNDLDPPEEDELPAVDDYEEDLHPPLATISPMAASSVERAAPFETESMNDTEEDDPVVPRPRPPGTSQNKEGRTFPLGMIAVVVVALLLLAVGGFGVMQQRSEMQAEIRDLQAKLATTVSPEEAEMERERQRQVQLQNESLSTELEALTAENDALAQRLAELEVLEAAQASAAAEKRAQEEAAAKAAAERQAAEEAAARRAANASSSAAAQSSATVSKGPWFVNFGSYADRTIADRWAKKLSVDSGQVTVQTARAAGKTLYRVRVVGLANQDSAERVATALERQYQLPRLWVGKN